MRALSALAAGCVAIAGCSSEGNAPPLAGVFADGALVGSFTDGASYVYATPTSVSIRGGQCWGNTFSIPHSVVIRPDGSFTASGFVTEFDSSRDTIVIHNGRVAGTATGVVNGDQITVTVNATVGGRSLQILTLNARRNARASDGGACRA